MRHALMIALMMMEVVNTTAITFKMQESSVHKV